jgi:hypothetical protein
MGRAGTLRNGFRADELPRTRTLVRYKEDVMRHLIAGCLLPISLLACSDGLAPTGPDDPSAPVRAAGAPIIRHFPGESPGVPTYALLSRGYAPSDGGWVGIVFTRDPACVPGAFNLLDWLNPPAAWGCTLTVEGEQWFHDPPVPPDFQGHVRGLGAVPVYFVALSEYQAAIADDVLTIGELEGLPSLLVGYASFFHQVYHNTNQPTDHGHETIVAHGTLEDGRTFQFRFNEKFLPETGEHVFSNVKITFE